MNTDAWIGTLSKDLKSVPRHLPTKLLAAALTIGAIASTAMTHVLFEIRPDLAQALFDPPLWLKLAFPALVAVAACMALSRLSTPGRDTGPWLRCAWVPFAAMVGLSALMMLAGPSSWVNDPWWTGVDWQTCTMNIAIVSVPVMVPLMFAVRQLAPTQLRLTGGVAGLLSGAMATFAYALHCPEMSVPFLALWNGLAMVLMGVLGASLGPRLLRW
jgi:hypothetical protein